MFTKEEKEKLKRIELLFNQIEEIYDGFSPETKDYIRQYHNMEGSIPHCIRWGIQGIDELLGEETVFEVGTSFVVKKKIDCGIGYIPEGTNATLSLIHYNQLRNEDSEPFQFEFDKFVAYEEADESDGYCEELSIKKVKEHLSQL